MVHAPAPKASGTQGASKALDLLKRVGYHHPQGVRLRDLISESGLDRSTTHRLMACLLDAGFVERGATGKLYRLGMEAMPLGLPENQTLAICERHAAAYGRIGISQDRMMVHTARQNYFAEMTDFRTEETSGLGCAFPLSSHTHAGISVGAIHSRMPPARRKEMGATLVREAQPLACNAQAAGALAE